MQDYPLIEYFILDGGSTDGSLEIIQRYANQIDYWVSQPDEGQAHAINKGLQKASGEVVAWLNSDDVYLPNAVRDAVNALNEYPDAGMVYGDGIMVSGDLEIYDRHHYSQLSLVDLLAFEVILQPAVFMRKYVLEDVGYLDPGYDLILDHELWVRIASRYSIRHIPRMWALERTHAQAKTIAQAERFVEEAENMIKATSRSAETGAIIEANKRRIYAGLAIFSARRLIDAKKHRRALRMITGAIFQHPPSVAKYWYKWVQAAFSSLGLDPLFMWYRKTRRRLLFSGRRINIDDYR
jgi:glycosyltransferase involved in cell wall biosynthesis